MRSLAIACVCATLVGVGCRSERSRRQLVLAVESGPKTFNPHLANDATTSRLIKGPVYTNLVDFDPARFEDRLVLARAREVSEDGLTWTYHLRKGLRWSDGHPFSAADVLFNLELAFSPGSPSAARDAFEDSQGRLPAYEEVGPLTVRFRLHEVSVLFESALGSLYLIPKHRWAKAVAERGLQRILGTDTPPADVVGLGPFVIADWVADQRLVLKRNPHSWLVDDAGKPLPRLDRVTWLITSDNNATLLKFLSGETHVLSPVRPEQVDLLRRRAGPAGFDLHDVGPSLATHYLTFNLNPGRAKDGRPFVEPWLRDRFEDVRVRRAVSHAIDREALVRTALLGRGHPLYCFVGPANRAWYHPCTRYQHDPGRARALLGEAGLADRDGDGIREDATGRPLAFSLITNVENTARVAAANTIQADLARVGVRVDVKPIPFSALLDRFAKTYRWEALLLGWSTGVPPDPVMFKNIYLSSGRTHVWHPRQLTPTRPWEAEIDRLVGTLTSTRVRAARREAHDRLMDVLGEQQPQIFLFSENVWVGARREVGNLRPVVFPPHGTWNLAELYLKK